MMEKKRRNCENCYTPVERFNFRKFFAWLGVLLLLAFYSIIGILASLKISEITGNILTGSVALMFGMSIIFFGICLACLFVFLTDIFDRKAGVFRDKFIVIEKIKVQQFKNSY